MKLFIFVQRTWAVCTLIVLVFITVMSLWPLEELPGVPGSDKTHHIIAYAVLMLPTALRRPNHWKLIGLSFVVYGGTVELLQPYVNRYGEWWDMAANTIGILCGLLLAELIFYFVRKSGNSTRISSR